MSDTVPSPDITPPILRDYLELWSDVAAITVDDVNQARDTPIFTRDPGDFTWDIAMSQPVVRDELSRFMQLMQSVLLSHVAHDAARLSGDEVKIKETGLTAVAQTMQIGELLREFLTYWTGKADWNANDAS